MFEDFGDRFRRVNELLTSADTAFVLVTSPEEEVLAEAEEFRVGLERLDVALKGVVVNRVHEEWQGKGPLCKGPAALVERFRKVLHVTPANSAQLQWLAENFLAYQTLARGEGLRLEHFAHSLPAHIPLVRIPVLPAFPADLGGLLTLHRYLLGKPSLGCHAAASRKPQGWPKRKDRPRRVFSKQGYSICGCGGPTTPPWAGPADQSSPALCQSAERNHRLGCDRPRA